MSPELERWYAALLRLYPASYRDEMLATLDEADRPAGRETVARLIGALRPRSGRESPGRMWLSALRLGVLALVAYGTAGALAKAGRVVFSDLLPGRGLALPSDAGQVGATVVGLLALWALAAGRYVTGLLLTFAAFAAIVWAISWYPVVLDMLVDDQFWPLPLALVLMTPLLRGRLPRGSRPALWLLAVPAAAVLLPTAFDASLGWQPFSLFALGLTALVWTVVDGRVPVAVGVLFLVPMLNLVVFWTPGWYSSGPVALWFAIYGCFAVVLLATGALGIRRQARL